MKTSLTLSAVLFALTLTPAAFANGAQEQTQEVAATDTAAASTPVTEANTPAPATLSVTRSILERLEVDVRQDLIGSLRESALLVLQFAAPALLEAASVGAAQVDLGAR
jgi:hypothetical protein